MIHNFSLLYAHFIFLFTSFLPDAPLLMRLRGALLRLCLKSCGTNFQVSSTTIIRGLNNIDIGNNVYLAPGTVILSSGEVTLGDDVMIGINSVITDGNHTMLEGSYRFGKRTLNGVKVGKGSWVASNCTLLPGSVLPESSVLAANSSLRLIHTIPGLYAGSPAKLIKAN
jgi:acetyltransferase-like isoleucine patch superfamily enzyme